MPDYLLRFHLEDISPTTAGGVGSFAKQLLLGMAPRRNPDSLLAITAPNQGREWADALEGRVRVEELPRLLTMPEGGFTGTLRAQARRLPFVHGARAGLRAVSMKSDRRRVVADYFPYHRSRAFGRHVFVTVHDLRVYDEQFIDLPSQGNIEENTRKASVVFCSWRHPSQQLLARFPEHAHKFREVPFPPMLPGGTASRRVGKYLLFPAATSPHKNHRLLLQYARACPEGPAVICVGPEVEPEASFLRALARESKVGSAFELRGLVSDEELDSLLSECLALVMPSRFEAASGPIMEAFARGIPVVSADIPPLRAQIEQSNGDAAWFDPMSVVSLAGAVDLLRGDYQRFEAASQRAGTWYKNLDWTATADAYLGAIDEAMARRGGHV